MGGDPSSAELAEGARSVWTAVGRGGPAGWVPPEDLKLHKSGPLLVRLSCGVCVCVCVCVAGVGISAACCCWTNVSITGRHEK